MIKALTAIKMASAAVSVDCMAISTTPVTVLVVCFTPSSSTKIRMQTTDSTRTTWMKMLIQLPALVA